MKIEKITSYQSNYGDVTLAINAIKVLIGDRLVENEAILNAHGGGEVTYHESLAPNAVAFVENTEEVAQIVKICDEHCVPIIPFGAGSSLEGHVSASFGGISIDLSKMIEVVTFHQEDMSVTVQAGLTRQELNHYLRDQGMFFPIDPGAEATLGGMASTRASGTNAVKYGTMRDNVISMTAVMANGDVIKTGSRAIKSSAGFDLTRLLIGSEGNLGIITELTLKLYPIPEQIMAATVQFENLEDACELVIATVQAAIPVGRIELLDDVQMKACIAYSKLDMAEKPTLFLEFEGSPTYCNEQIDLFKEFAEEFGAQDFKFAEKLEDRNNLWKARHNAYWAGCDLAPGLAHMSTDVCIPISNFAKCVNETKQDILDNDLIGPIVGHAGDGNFHVLLSFDDQDADAVKAVKAFLDRLVDRALKYEGTCTGEHGVGLGKAKYLRQEHGAALDHMFLVKKALDPKNILNPGKIFYG